MNIKLFSFASFLLLALLAKAQMPPLPPAPGVMPADWGQLSTGYYPPVKNSFTEKPGWTLVFFDEFNGPANTGLNPLKWNLAKGTWNDVTFSDASDVSIAYQSNGTLKLKTLYTPGASYTDPVSGACTRDVKSSIFRSNTSTFGPNKYYEIRCKLPVGALFHQGFFVFSDYAPNYWSEVDFLENGSCYNGGLTHIGTNYHKGFVNGLCSVRCPADNTSIDPQFTYSCESSRGGECVSGHGFSPANIDGTPFSNTANLSQDFYTIGVEWTNNEILWYLNHKLIRRTTTDIPQIPGEMWLGVAVDNYGNNLPQVQADLAAMNAQGLFPGIYEIDYIRVYEKNCGIGWPINYFGVLSVDATDNNTRPRLIGDVNGDGKDDIVYFGVNFTRVSLSTGTGYAAPQNMLSDYTVEQGWTNQSLHPRFLADVNGDGLKDIVGFSSSAVYVSLAKVVSGVFSFNAPAMVVSDYTPAQGWTNQVYSTRYVEDVNGDGKADIVGFGWNLEVSLSTTASSPVTALTIPTFAARATVVLNQFTVSQGWTDNGVQPKLLGDINNDGKADIVGFGAGSTFASLSNCTTGGVVSFTSPNALINDYTTTQGWTNQNERPRLLGDVNGDGKKDIVVFGYQNIQVHLSTSNATTASIGPAGNALEAFTVEQGWTNMEEYPRFLEDVNNDGKADIVGIGHTDVYIAKGKFSTAPLYGGSSVGFDAPSEVLFKYFSKWDGWVSQSIYPRFLADVDGNGTKGIIGFGWASVNTWDCSMTSTGSRLATGAELPEEHQKAGERFSADIRLYPNPSSNHTSLEFLSDNRYSEVMLKVYNAEGKVVLEQELSSGKALHAINTAALAPGLYLFHITSDGNMIGQKKFVKE